jgi:hypothetical protein
MRSIDLDAVVTEDGKLIVTVPPDIRPGEHHVRLVVEEPPDPRRDGTVEFLVIHVDSWPTDLSLSREAMYGDDGR